MTQEQQIKNIAEKLNMSERKALIMYHETGINYIEQLKQAVVFFKVFKLQFGSIIESGALDGLSVPETFRRISVAREFWDWWLIQLWAIANDNYFFQTIPSNIMNRIFQNQKHDTKNNISRKRTASKPKAATANTCC